MATALLRNRQGGYTEYTPPKNEEGYFLRLRSRNKKTTTPEIVTESDTGISGIRSSSIDK